MSRLTPPSQWTPTRPMSNIMSDMVNYRQEGGSKTKMGIDCTIQNTVFGSRRMADRQKWDLNNASDSDKLMVLSWNGGNLDRPCNNDTLLKVLTGNQHVSILQEGWSQRLDQWLYTHAMKSSISCCSSLRVVLGGSGLKGIVYTYDFSSYDEFNCVRRNTTNRKRPMHSFGSRGTSRGFIQLPTSSYHVVIIIIIVLRPFTIIMILPKSPIQSMRCFMTL